MHFLSPDQQSVIHCLIICEIQLLTLNILGRTWRRICLPDIRGSSTWFLRNRALQMTFIYLLTYSGGIGRRFCCCCCCSLLQCHLQTHSPTSWSLQQRQWLQAMTLVTTLTRWYSTRHQPPTIRSCPHWRVVLMEQSQWTRAVILGVVIMPLVCHFCCCCLTIYTVNRKKLDILFLTLICEAQTLGNSLNVVLRTGYLTVCTAERASAEVHLETQELLFLLWLQLVIRLQHFPQTW